MAETHCDSRLGWAETWLYPRAHLSPVLVAGPQLHPDEFTSSGGSLEWLLASVAVTPVVPGVLLIGGQEVAPCYTKQLLQYKL